MDARYYCDTMTSELTGLKARIYQIVREMERVQEADKVRLGPQISELFNMVDHLKDKIDELGHECPADWSSQKQEIDTMKLQLAQKIDLWDAEHIAGGYVGG